MIKDIFIFTGKVFPERADVSMPTITLSDLKSETKGTKLNGKLVVSIAYSQISATLTAETDQDIFTLRIAVEHVIRNIVDSLGYFTGRGYDIEITSCTDSSGKQTVFGVGIPELEQYTRERSINLIDLYVKVVSKSKELQFALANLRESIRSPWDTGLFCYRAIDCIRKRFVLATDKPEKDELSWERLKEALRIDRSWIDVIKGPADKQRHGFSPEFMNTERIKVMENAWKIVDRFCEYALNGYKPLPETSYPILE